MSEQVRDVLNRRYPVDSRRQLGEAVYDRLNLKRQVLESVIRADEKNGRDASEKNTVRVYDSQGNLVKPVLTKAPSKKD